MESEQIIQKRLGILTLLVGLFCFVLLGRLFYLQMMMGDRYGKIARFNIIKESFIPAPRGKILDRNGYVLAMDVPRLNICAVISEIEDERAFALKLAPLIGYTPKRIMKILEKNRYNPYQKAIIKPRVEMDTVMKIAEIQGDLPGLYMEVHPVREYPNGEVASHVIGYVGPVTEEELKTSGDSGITQGDVNGKDGIEKYYDQYLRGKKGAKQELVNASGKVIGNLSEIKPKPGYNLYLSLDLPLQNKVEAILKRYVGSLARISREPLAGAVIILDNRTGEVLAMASYPGFDPNMFSRGVSERFYNRLISRKDYPLMNRCISGAYPPASTFKMITAGGALQEKLCTCYSPFYCPGSYKVGTQRFYCFVTSGHGKIDFSDSIAESCDVVYYILGRSLGIERLLKYSEQFGIGRKTGVDLPGETGGILPNNYWKMKYIREPWYTGDTVNMSIGQGYLAVTPLQMAVVTGIVANLGRMYKPHLVRTIERSDGAGLKRIGPEESHRVDVRPEHLSAIFHAMRGSVTRGTAKNLYAPLRFAGKTGTAESFKSPENPHGRNHTWFVGAGPVNDPRVVVVVFMEKSGGLAGRMAVPLAGAIISAYKETYDDKNR